MSLDVTWSWFALLFLGAIHGLNPGMGWLFAVALGVQRGERRAVWQALLPLTVGHAMAIAAAVLVAGLLGLVVPLDHLPWVVAGALVLLGVRQLRRHRHPRFGGMRIGGRDLVIWSFLVATAHGAGLMAVPFAATAGAVTSSAAAFAAEAPQRSEEHVHGANGSGHQHHGAGAARSVSGGALIATLVHTAGYVLVTAVLALLVYQFAGIRLLRRAWVNVDLVWAGVLVLTGMALLAL
jgi:hypothetical protein